MIANHLGRFVPGNPMFVVQNMTGGGSKVAANNVYGVAKPDGLTLGVVSPAMYIEQVIGKKEVQYDWFKFSFIGSPEKTERIFYIAPTPRSHAVERCRSRSVDQRGRRAVGGYRSTAEAADGKLAEYFTLLVEHP
jgi:hypothetical protein